jgi:hypothetical protein
MSARQTLLLFGSLVSLPIALLPAQSTSAPQSRYTLSGIVRDEAQAPISNAELKLARQGEVPRVARTGEDGRFDFDKVQPGDVKLSVRRMGYRAASRDLSVNGETASKPVDFALVTAATDVETVIVEGENDKLHEFYERRRTNNFGKYFDGNEIRRRDPRLMSDLLRTIPGVGVSSANRTQNRIQLRGCRPTIWENGMKAFGAELDDVANPTDIAGLEVYMSWAGLPPQYQDRENPGCGAILVWTRDH